MRTRREVLRSGAGLSLGLGAAGVVTWSGMAGASGAPADRRFHALTLPSYPFTLGVASGDPTPDGVVLWTRLAPNPLASDGLGGMPPHRATVEWELAADDTFRQRVRRGTVDATPASAHSIHVEVDGLRPGQPYWYRFRVGPHLSRVGMTRTAPPDGTLPKSLAMAFVSCSQFEHGWFTAYRRLAEDRPDLVLHLGDYQYEYAKNTYVAGSGNVRDHDGPETVDLASYRQRHAQYKTDLDLQEAHAVAPWLVVFDDHEVENNWAGGIPENPADTPSFAARKAAAFQSYYENMPLRRASIPRDTSIQIYRRLSWGRLATFHMLDTRQFRDDQACGDGFKANCAAATDPTRSITGARQEEWLLQGFQRSRARWDVLGQQVFFAQRDSTSGPVTTVSMDAWDGYAASRDRITRGFVDAGVRNPVVLTGDVHAHWAAELKLDYADPTSRSVGTELVCSSITSGGDGSDAPLTAHPWLPWNPHVKMQNNLRGYVRTTITPEQMTADFRVVPRVSQPGAAATTRASFVIEDRVPTLNLVADNPIAVAGTTRRAPVGAPTGQDTIEAETQRPPG